LRVLIESSYIFWLANLHSSPTPDRDGDSQEPRCLDQTGFHADEVLVRGQLDRALVELASLGISFRLCWRDRTRIEINLCAVIGSIALTHV
jgi:hypothetical protein